jgi:hypothetical protein
VRGVAAAPSGRRSLGLRPLLSFAILGLSALPLFAQGGGPSLASDSVPLERTIPEREAVANDMARSRYHLGPVRLLPGFAVHNAGYDSNVFGTSTDPVGDWTATVSAGSRFLLPLGGKFVLVADAFPEYTWYATLTQRDQFGGNYGGSLYGFFNRVTTEFAARYSERFYIYSSEIESPVFTKNEDGIARMEVELGAHWSVFGFGEINRVRYDQIQGPPEQEIGVEKNNRTAWAGRGGLRYRISEEWQVAGMVEGSWADFEVDPRLRNNTSQAYLGSLEYSRPRLFINVIGGLREGKGEDSVLFPKYSTGVGSFFTSFFALPWLEVQAFGHRQVAYSITTENPYYLESRLGGKINIQIGPRLLLNGYGLKGPNNYPRAQPVPDDGVVKRRDVQSLYGGGFSVLTFRPVVVTGQYTRNQTTSNIPGNARGYNRYTLFLSFSGVLER